MSDTLCALPWKHLAINPEGTVKVCCRAHESISRDGVAMSVYHHTFEEIWNSEYMVSLRKGMLNGEKISACVSCYQEESYASYSYRTQSNSRWLDAAQINRDEFRRQAAAAGGVAATRPIYVQFNLGNLCNLKCRMCTASYSSQIERDPVHSRWAPLSVINNVGQTYWSKDAFQLWERQDVVVGPAIPPGVSQEGFLSVETHLGRPCGWTGGYAVITVPVYPGLALERMTVKLWPYRLEGHKAAIKVNGTALFEGVVPPESWETSFDLTPFQASKELKIELLSDTFSTAADPRPLGLPVEGITIHQRPQRRKPVFDPLPTTSRFTDGRAWYEQDALLFDEILVDYDAVEELYFTGGEPLLHHKFYEILEYFIEKGVAHRVTLQLNSNCTKVTERFIELAQKFRKVNFALSVDAFGDVYEYMRYPARWAAVAQNVKALTALPNAHFCAVPVIQSLNMLHIVDLLRFMDQLGIAFSLIPLTGPPYLSVSVMPTNIRAEAVRRLREYLDTDCRPALRVPVEAGIAFIEQEANRCTPETLREFMTFTNDLDRSRGQDLRKTLPELARMLEEAGISWSEETRFVASGAVPGKAPETLPPPAAKAAPALPRLYDETGTQLLFELPEPGAGNRPSTLLFAMPKAGSVMINDAMALLCEQAGARYVSYPNALVNLGIAEKAIPPAVTQLFRPNGYCYGGFRLFPANYSIPILEDAKRVLLIRDPRDMLVSSYYSMAYSHPLPTNDQKLDLTRNMQDFRNRALNATVDSYALNNASYYRGIFSDYGDILIHPLTLLLRYEDVIYDKPRMLQSISNFFGWEVSRETITKVAAQIDIIPETENVNKHIRQVHPGNHKVKLAGETIERLNEVFEPYLKRFGYDL